MGPNCPSSQSIGALPRHQRRPRHHCSFERLERRILLSGTPIVATPEELARARPLTGDKTALVRGHHAPAPAGEGLPRPRRHHLNRPRPPPRTVPPGCASTIVTTPMAFTVIPAARPCLTP